MTAPTNSSPNAKTKYEKYYVVGFKDDETAKRIRSIIVNDLGYGVTVVAAYNSVKDIAENIEDDLA